ncbi:unnamed protein product [Medioppia subpectinata]|uniref:Nuclear receptor domain-containing protein n=1 Tax=Medioppia subpectinata TaxID=1979941 RepID=A0A7R9KFL0_9ACAR|nr:unnamed protein product [Medioppia subpectinata]CAG2101293.1 unnamed protein product [Medioppia subpectinata]
MSVEISALFPVNPKLKCLFENNCEMDVEMRSDCRKCRLEKCFAIGMRKEVLLTDEEKEEKKRKMKKNKQLFAVKNNTNKVNGKIYTSTDSSSTPSMVVSSEETSILFEFLDNNNINKETLDLQIRELEDILSVESNSSEVTALSTNCDTIPAHIICHTLNESEGMKFNELMAATYDQLFETIPIITSEVSDVWEGIKMMTIRCETAVKEQIKRFNNFTAFGNMCENDRILLAKGSATQLAFRFDSVISITIKMYGNCIV